MFIIVLLINSIYGYSINLSFDDCVTYIFNTFDENQDGYLDKWECEKLQYETYPKLPLTWKHYKSICNLTGAIFGLGLEKKHLSYTYNELRNILGTNIYNDMVILLNKYSYRRSI